MNRDVQQPTAAAEPIGPRLLRGAIGGFVAGLVFIGLTMWFSNSLGNPAEAPLRLIHSIIAGADALETGDASAAMGFVVHSVVATIFGMAFALVAPVLRRNGTLAITGGVYGLALYVLNFQILARLFWDRFLEGPNQPFEVVVHLVFGYLVALAFYSSGPRRDEPIIDLRIGREERKPAAASGRSR